MRVDPLNYEQSFSIEVSPYKDGIVKLANDQRQIINDHLRDFIEIQQAFELFGQGVLYDERRGTSQNGWNLSTSILWATEDGMDS